MHPDAVVLIFDWIIACERATCFHCGNQFKQAVRLDQVHPVLYNYWEYIRTQVRMIIISRDAQKRDEITYTCAVFPPLIVQVKVFYFHRT